MVVVGGGGVDVAGGGEVDVVGAQFVDEVVVGCDLRLSAKS